MYLTLPFGQKTNFEINKMFENDSKNNDQQNKKQKGQIWPLEKAIWAVLTLNFV